MNKLNLGYCCINTTLKKEGIFTNRTMRQKTFLMKGLPFVSELALRNVKDLLTHIKWNQDKGINLFRVSSNIFPWMTEYELKDLPDYEEINWFMKMIGRFTTQYNQRLTMHPGPFNCLGSPNPKVVNKTIIELNRHSEQFDMMGFEPSPYNKINIHVGGTYGDKEATMGRFCENFHKLDINTKKRLTVENDDSPKGFNVKDLYEGIYNGIGIPIVFDYYHHTFNDGGLTEEEALKLAAETWPPEVKQCCHYSESRRKEKLDETIRPQAHSDLIYNKINTYGLNPDINIEAKQKEQAVLNYYKNEKESERKPMQLEECSS